MENVRTPARKMALVVLMALLLIASGFFLFMQSETGGTTVKWDYCGTEAFGSRSNSYMANAVGEDGTVYATEALGAWNATVPRYNLLAICPDGKLRWKAEGLAGGQCREHQGRLYHAGGHDLRLIGPDGTISWTYGFDNGTIVLCGVFPDGTVLVRHDNNWDAYLNNSLALLDELVAVSMQGVLKWSMDLTPLSDQCMANPLISANGTMLLFIEGSESSYESGYDSEGKALWTMEIAPKGAHYLAYGPSRGPVYYTVRKEGLNDTTSSLKVMAFDSSNGSCAWTREFACAPISVGAIWISPAHLDGRGTVYAVDIDERRVLALDSDGALLWAKSFAFDSMLGACEGGGLLLHHMKEDQTYEVIRVGGNGHILWRVGIETSGGWSGPILNGRDGSFYYGEGNRLLAYSPSTVNIYTFALTASLTMAAVAFVLWHRSGNGKEN